MKTLNLAQAAALLHMHRVTLLLKAQSGVIPAAKPAKCWVFIEQDILDYLRGLYNYGNKKSENIEIQSNSTIPNRFSSKSAYLQLLGIADCPQIHSPQRVPRSGACHADGVGQVAKGEAVGLVVKSVSMTQSKRG